MRVEDTLTMRRFPVTVKTDCKNIDRIYPLKQKQVSEICSRAGQFDIVRKIYVFGSSVTPRCTIDSDLDLCGWNCDIVMYENIGSALRETVKGEGVVVYE